MLVETQLAPQLPLSLSQTHTHTLQTSYTSQSLSYTAFTRSYPSMTGTEALVDLRTRPVMKPGEPDIARGRRTNEI